MSQERNAKSKRNHVLSEAWPGWQSPCTDLLSPGRNIPQPAKTVPPSLPIAPIPQEKWLFTSHKSTMSSIYLLEPGLASTVTKMVKPKATRWAAAPEAVRRAR